MNHKQRTICGILVIFVLAHIYVHYIKILKTNHLFKDGATFEKALNMYRFDRKLRLMLFNEIEKIEVAIRSALVNIVSDGTGDVFWVTDATYFYDRQGFNNSLGIINTEIGRTKEEFILHFQNIYDNTYPPSWMMVEILPLEDYNFVYSLLSEA